MGICEELLHAESDALEHREEQARFDSFTLSERLLAIDDMALLSSAAPIAMRLCCQFHSQGRSFEVLPIARMCAIADVFDSLIENAPLDHDRSMNDAFFSLSVRQATCSWSRALLHRTDA